MDAILKALVKVKPSLDSVDIDNNFSRLHYRVTAFALLLFGLLVSSEQHFGTPISCLLDVSGDASSIPDNVINSYCFMANTYTLFDHPERGSGKHSISTRFAYPGVRAEDPDDARKRHSYYQWVPLVFFLQAILFLVPHWFWLGCERGTVRRFVNFLDEGLEMRLSQQDSEELYEVAYSFNRFLGQNRLLGFGWIATDLFALLNVIGNFLLTDLLLGGSFSLYGLKVFDWLPTSAPTTPIFPLMTKCSFNKYGSSGGIQLRDAICVMNLNIVNEKLFLVLWVWFLVLFHFTILGIFCKIVRVALLKFMASNIWISTIGIPTRIVGKDLPYCTRNMSFSDCVLFYLMAKNMRPLTYRTFVKKLCEAMRKDTKSV